MAVKKTKLQQRIESGEIIEQKCWQYIKELNSVNDARLDAVALIDCRRSYTYRQMFRKWERYAEVFSALNMTGAHSARVGLLSETSANSIFALYALNMTGASVSMLPLADLSVKEHCKNLIQKERITDLVLCDTKLNPELLGWLAKSREALGLGSIIVMHVPTEGPFVGQEISMYFRMLAPQLRRIPGVLFMDQLLQQYEATPISYAKDGLSDDNYDLTIDHIGAGQANTTELCLNHAMYDVQLADATLATLCEQGYDYVTVPAGTWKGQDVDIKTVGSQQCIIVSADMDEEVAYNITKALCENRDILVNTSAVLANFNPEVSGSKALTGCELHPGAARYYAEMGYAHE